MDGKQKFVVGYEVKDAKNLYVPGEAVADLLLVVRGPCSKLHVGDVQCQQPTSQVSFADMKNIWSDVMLEEDQYETAFIEFSVYKRNFFSRNDEIGSAALQLSFINKRDGHLFKNKSVNLRTKDSKEITGMLTVTCFVLRPGETVPNWHDDQSDDDKEGDDGEGGDDLLDPKNISKNILGGIPKDDNSKCYHVFVNIHSIEHLATRNGVKLSPFVTVEFGGHRLKTAVADQVDDYTFNKTCLLPVQTPIFEETILIKLWNHAGAYRRPWDPDELLAQGLISFNGLRNKPLLPRFFCMYGWDPDEMVGDGSSAAEVPEPNFYIGRLLISGRVKGVEPEEFESEARLEDGKPPQNPVSIQTTLLADVYEVHGVIGRNCKVELKFGGTVGKDDTGEGGNVTKWALPDKYERELKIDKSNKEDYQQYKDLEAEKKTSYTFSQSEGRIPAAFTIVPEDRDSRPYVMINVYTKGVLSGMRRVAYCKRHLEEFPIYSPGAQPSKPRSFALTPMPGAWLPGADLASAGKQPTTRPTVLMSIERSDGELILDSDRQDRVNVVPQTYLLRAYVFMARYIQDRDPELKDELKLRVMCAGVSQATRKLGKQIRPLWMSSLQLKLSLVSDHPKEPPSMEPISLSLETADGKVLGTTSCMYEYMRRKDGMGNWESFQLQPQWVKLFGGSFNKSAKGEVLIAFELLNAQDENAELHSSSSTRLKALAKQEMWPGMVFLKNLRMKRIQPWCKLRKATLHFALLGLRDLVSQATWREGGGLPRVIVEVKRVEEDKPQDKGSGGKKAFLLKFELIKHSKNDGNYACIVKRVEAALDHNGSELVGKPEHKEGEYAFDHTRRHDAAALEPAFDPKTGELQRFPPGHINQGLLIPRGSEDPKSLKAWESFDSQGDVRRNFEFYAVASMKVTLPDNTVMEPFVNIKVEEMLADDQALKRGVQGLAKAVGAAGGDGSVQVGEHRVNLCDNLPLNWYDVYDGDDGKGKKPSLNGGESKVQQVTMNSEAHSKLRKDDKGEITKEGKKFAESINIAIDRAVKKTVARDQYEGETEEDRAERLKKERLQRQGHGKKGAQSRSGGINFNWKQRELIDSSATPCQFLGIVQAYDSWSKICELSREASTNPSASKMLTEKLKEERDSQAHKDSKHHRQRFAGLGEEHRKEVKMPGRRQACNAHLNMHVAKSFTDAGFGKAVFGKDKVGSGWCQGPKDSDQEGGHHNVREFLRGSLEKPPPGAQGDDDRAKWEHDFWFKALPLLKNHDIFREEETADDQKTDWRLAGKQDCFGFIKFALKIEDGWAGDEMDENDEDQEDSGSSSSSDDGQDEPQKALGSASWLDAPALIDAGAGAAGGQIVVYNGEGDKKSGGSKQKLAATAAGAAAPSGRVRWSDVDSMMNDEVANFFAETKGDEELAQGNRLELLKKSKGLGKFRDRCKLRVRIYFVRGVVTFADQDGTSNPYLEYRVGSQRVSLKSMARMKDQVPEFYRVEERDIDMPEESNLIIQMKDMVTDGSVLGGDTDGIIGSTFIDLEDRWNSTRWNEKMELGNVPSETRELITDSDPKLNNGSIEMWIEMINSKDLSKPKSALSKPKQVELEVRIVIWGTRDIKAVDGDKTDVQIETTLQTGMGQYHGVDEGFPATQTTDVHMNCKTGIAEFNYRVVFKRIESRTEICTVTFVVQDYNTFSGPQQFGSVSVDLKKYLAKVSKDMEPIRLEKAEVDFKDTDAVGEDAESVGTLIWELWILQDAEAKNKPVGMAQNPPNEDPVLSVPTEGRGWGDALAGFGLDFGGLDTALLKKLLPVIIFALLCLVLLRWVGLL